jgi:hypothetical protein
VATKISPSLFTERVKALRDQEPDPFKATPDEVVAFIEEVRSLLSFRDELGADALTEAQNRYLDEASQHQVRFARTRLDGDRVATLETLSRLFQIGSVPQPDGRYAGEIVAISTGLLSDPFFDWMTRIYLPWLGKTFDVAAHSGDNVFTNNAGWKATGKLGWPEYRIADEADPGVVRVFPFRTVEAAALDVPDTRVLKLDYAGAPNPLPVRRIVDELVELPGGYLLGKAFMRGLREFRLVTYFGLYSGERIA